MRYRVAAGVGYGALMLFWIYGVLDQGLDVPETPTWILLAAAQVAVGALLSWPALLLPLGTVLASVPAGYSDSPRSGEELPIWFGVMVLAIPALVLVVSGVTGAIVAKRRVQTE